MAHDLRAEACSLAGAEAWAGRGDRRAVDCGTAAGGARWDGVRCPQELVSSVLASSCVAVGRGGVAPCSAQNLGAAVARDPLQRRRLWERRGPCWNPLEQQRGSSGLSGGNGRGPGARGLRFGMDGAPCFLSRKELRE